MPEEVFHILILYEGVLRCSTFQLNHYASVIFHAGKRPAWRRKIFSLNKKSKKNIKVDLNPQRRLPATKFFGKDLSECQSTPQLTIKIKY